MNESESESAGRKSCNFSSSHLHPRLLLHLSQNQRQFCMAPAAPRNSLLLAFSQIYAFVCCHILQCFCPLPTSKISPPSLSLPPPTGVLRHLKVAGERDWLSISKIISKLSRTVCISSHSWSEKCCGLGDCLACAPVMRVIALIIRSLLAYFDCILLNMRLSIECFLKYLHSLVIDRRIRRFEDVFLIFAL